MGGPGATYAATAASSAASDKRQRLDAAMHSLPKSTQHGGFKRRPHAANSGGDDDDNAEDESERFLRDGFDDDDDDDDDYQEQEVRAAAAATREREEMKKHFNFPLEKRRGLASHLASAMRKKRRLLLRNDNLRFRELYKAPEPMVLLIAASLVTIVTLILTKSWPFY